MRMQTEINMVIDHIENIIDLHSKFATMHKFHRKSEYYFQISKIRKERYK